MEGGSFTGDFEGQASLVSTQRQPGKLILGLSPSAKTRLLSLNRTQSRAVIGLLTGHNTLRRHLHLIRLIVPYVGGVGWRIKPWSAFFVKCEALASLRHAYLASFFLDPMDIKSLSLGVILNSSKGTGFP